MLFIFHQRLCLDIAIHTHCLYLFGAELKPVTGSGSWTDPSIIHLALDKESPHLLLRLRTIDIYIGWLIISLLRCGKSAQIQIVRSDSAEEQVMATAELSLPCDESYGLDT